MYFAHFGLKRAPFEDAGQDSAFYPGNKHRGALEFLHGAFGTPNLLVALTGPEGSGKTRTLEEFLARWNGAIAGGWLDALPATADEFLEAVLAHVGFQPVAADKSELRNILTVFLGHQAQKGIQVVLAARLAGSVAPGVVEEMAWMGSLEAVRQGRVKIVLVGDERLEKALDAPRNRALCKLVAHRHRLAPLSAEDTADYLEFRLESAGAPRPHEPFTEEAAAKIHAVSEGLPGSINALAEAALGRAWKAGIRRIGPDLVSPDPAVGQAAPADVSASRDETADPVRMSDGDDLPVLSLRLDGAPSVRRVLDRDRILVGRHEWNDLQLEHGSVSRHHALMVRAEGRWVIVDLNSTNGIRINGRRVKIAGLASGDRLEIGEFSGTVHGLASPAAPDEDYAGTVVLGARA
jgi:type II secretory pathway predicted ATPase ExeA